MVGSKLVIFCNEFTAGQNDDLKDNFLGLLPVLFIHAVGPFFHLVLNNKSVRRKFLAFYYVMMNNFKHFLQCLLNL